MTEQWIVHPNRFDTTSSGSGNGRFRSIKRGKQPPAPCQARIGLPPALADYGDPDGTVTFQDARWSLVVCGARNFAATHTAGAVTVPPFDFLMKGKWHWWDGTVADHSMLDTPDALDHITRFLWALFPEATAVDVTDRR